MEYLEYLESGKKVHYSATKALILPVGNVARTCQQQIFKSEFKKTNCIFLLVIICVKVGKCDSYTEYKYQSLCGNDNIN